MTVNEFRELRICPLQAALMSLPVSWLRLFCDPWMTLLSTQPATYLRVFYQVPPAKRDKWWRGRCRQGSLDWNGDNLHAVWRHGPLQAAETSLTMTNRINLTRTCLQNLRLNPLFYKYNKTLE